MGGELVGTQTPSTCPVQHLSLPSLPHPIPVQPGWPSFAIHGQMVQWVSDEPMPVVGFSPHC